MSWLIEMPETAMAYLDESGDLGWKLTQPYGAGGSSRFFVVAIAIGQGIEFRRFGKIIDSLRKSQKWTSNREKKWATISHQARRAFCQIAATELNKNEKLHVLASVCRKDDCADFMRSEDVRLHYPDKSEAELQILEQKFRGRSHLCYSMMTAEVLSEHMPKLDVLTYCPDDLNESVRTLEHILAYKLLYQDARQTELRHAHYQSAMQPGLAFVDLIAGAVWDHFENGINEWMDILGPFIRIKNIPSTWK